MSTTTETRTGGRRVRRIGIFGGAFDPVHIGHLLVAQDVKEKLRLDMVLFLLAFRPPHKRCVLDFLTRRELLLDGLRGYRGFYPCELEADRSGRSYTVESLARLRRQYPRDRLFLLLGSDQYAELPTWKEPGRLPEYAGLVVLARPGTPPVRGIVPARIVAVRQIEVSSSEIRSRIARGLSIRGMVPDAVLCRIERAGLYQPRKHRSRPGSGREKGSQ